jgi:hypothetical protein
MLQSYGESHENRFSSSDVSLCPRQRERRKIVYERTPYGSSAESRNGFWKPHPGMALVRSDLRLNT